MKATFQIGKKMKRMIHWVSKSSDKKLSKSLDEKENIKYALSLFTIRERLRLAKSVCIAIDMSKVYDKEELISKSF